MARHRVTGRQFKHPVPIFKPVTLVSTVATCPRGERRGRAGRGHVVGTGLSGIAGTDLPTHLQAGQVPHMLVLRAILCSSGRSTDTVNHTAPAGVTAEAHYSRSRLLSVDL